MKILFTKVIVSLICLAVIAAFPMPTRAEESPAPFLFWEVPFGYDALDVARLLELDRGVRFTKTFHAPSALTPEHTTIDSANDDDISLFGLPFHLSYDDYYDTFVLTFNFSGPWAERASSTKKITDGLFSKYGAPDRITVESPDHTLITATPMNSGTSSLAAAIACLEINQLPPDGCVIYRLNNIVGTIKSDADTETSSLVIEFHPNTVLIKGDEGFDTF